MGKLIGRWRKGILSDPICKCYRTARVVDYRTFPIIIAIASLYTNTYRIIPIISHFRGFWAKKQAIIGHYIETLLSDLGRCPYRTKGGFSLSDLVNVIGL